MTVETLTMSKDETCMRYFGGNLFFMVSWESGLSAQTPYRWYAVYLLKIWSGQVEVKSDGD